MHQVCRIAVNRGFWHFPQIDSSVAAGGGRTKPANDHGDKEGGAVVCVRE